MEWAAYISRWIDKKTGRKTILADMVDRIFGARKSSMRESSHSRKESDARKLLKKRLGEIAARQAGRAGHRAHQLRGHGGDDRQRLQSQWSQILARLEDAIAHLREYFGDRRALEITGDIVTAYITFRQEQKAAGSTINNELAALSRMFTLGIRAGKIATKPYIGKLALNNTRKGFFEWEQFHPILKNLPEDLQPAIETAYITGWRIHDEIFTRQKHHADLKGVGWLRLDPGETKNREGRNFPFTLGCVKSSRHNWNEQEHWRRQPAGSSPGYFIATENRSKHSGAPG